ncbi:MAG: hypothetical protein ACXW3T_13920, partial [Rhodoplanes sp.]
HAVLLVLDATVGQNALSQVEEFLKTAGVTGLVMTKLDGTARGGILVAIAEKFGLPIHFIGIGEGVDDLQPFTARGGILVAVSAKFGLPVHFIGVGEGIDDLSPFAARDFARAVAGLEG